MTDRRGVALAQDDCGRVIRPSGVIPRAASASARPHSHETLKIGVRAHGASDSTFALPHGARNRVSALFTMPTTASTVPRLRGNSNCLRLSELP
jgi:hypothetical protein